MGVLRVRRVGRDRHAVGPGRGAGRGHEILEVDLDAGLLGAGGGGGVVAGPAGHGAELAVRQGVDVVGVVEGGEEGPHLLQRLDGGRIVGGVGGAAVLAEPGEHHRDDVLRAVEHRDAAVGELLGILGLHQHVERGEVGVGEALAHQVHVVGDADRAPHVGRAVGVARVPGVEDAQDLGVEVRPAGEPCLVERHQELRLDEARHVGAGDVDHVVAGHPGEHLRLHLLGRGVDVVVDGNAGPGGEVLDRRLADVVGPVVDVEHGVLGAGASDVGRGQRAAEHGERAPASEVDHCRAPWRWPAGRLSRSVRRRSFIARMRSSGGASGQVKTGSTPRRRS